MLIGYARVSKADGSQSLELQYDALTKAQVRLAQAAMDKRDTSVTELCKEVGIRPVTLYRYVGPIGELRENCRCVLAV